MKITTIGRGNIGRTLGRLWASAGHEVTELGRDGGDASDAEVVLIAVPSGAVPDALTRVTGLDGKVVLDATNRMFCSTTSRLPVATSGSAMKAPETRLSN